MKICVFAGSFDPFTKGHEFVVDKCLELFDKVIIAIGVNTNKTPMFSSLERKEMIMKNYASNPRVQVEEFNGMLVDFMKDNQIKFNVRGIRDEQDYNYETTMERYNKDMYPDLVTLYIPTPSELIHLSSSGIRNIIELSADYKKYLPDNAVAEVEKIIALKRAER
jgi:pantetheine-phosphate adenylyltransferase